MHRSSGRVGEGHAQAWMRQGLRELRAAFYPDSNVAQSPEYGLYGTRTPGEIAESRRQDGPEIGATEPRSIFDRHGSAERPAEHERTPKDLERE